MSEQHYLSIARTWRPRTAPSEEELSTDSAEQQEVSSVPACECEKSESCERRVSTLAPADQEQLEELEARAAWERFLSGRPGWKREGDRAAVARHLLNLAWRQGDMGAALVLVDALVECEQARLAVNL